ncbi:hypothetical protein 010DV004_280 [Bacillus phage 010DV004]|nr:hypothetical protein 010DV004_15 [Bacillus phage 010DV004]QZA69233.1 hypothetical protein 010DV005_15 [Bacillus phage 010DV005]QZA69801.1 hypothetical protein 043JT007_15 [Bacillus phage 043JT007]QZA69212.1 hypothetical protein 010DV004_280 [Bacillus phage 010DV004]QZA69493.1 hypothetical protein 010DV005_281 [Bacillus phage 010DV005]
MALIPVFKECTKEYLMENWEVEFPLSDWVSIELPFKDVKELDKELDSSLFEIGDTVEYETNRYDVKYRDSAMGKTISVYVYMDESSSKIIAIDSAVQDCEKDYTTYPIEETPFADMLQE